MIKHLFICILTILALSSCSDDDNDFTGDGTGGNIEIPSPYPNDVINQQLFDLINLDYPGLEKAKAYYEKEEYFYAAQSILEYYRTRTGITNPNVSLINVNASETDRKKADDALDDYRFFVNNYTDEAAGKPYSLKKNGAIDWTLNPANADEYQKQLHRHQWFVPQAKTYRATKDEKYIRSWIEVYNDWINQNPMPTEGTNNTSWWQLQVAERTLSQVDLFDYYKHSINFTPQWFTTFMINFAQHADFLARYPYSGGNILVSQASALAYAGVLFPEFKNAESWASTGFRILNDEVKSQFLPDGMHIELDFSYHISAVADFYNIMKLSEANGLSAKYPSDFKEPLRKAVDVVLHFVYPSYLNTKLGGYLVPGFNDTRQDSWTRNVLRNNFKRYVEMFPANQEYQYMATLGQQGTQPAITPQLFDKGGYYVLRNGWTSASTMLIHSNNYDYSDNPLKIWSHNQPDNGTFELYHNGRNFFPDTGVYSYYTAGSANESRIAYRRTLAHNTLTLNGQDITHAVGKLVKSSVEGSTDVVVTENQGYDNLKHRRYIFFVDKKFFVLVDEGIGAGTGRININFNLCEGTDTEVIVDQSANGAHTAFPDGNNILVRSFGNNTLSTVPFEGRVSYKINETAKRQGYSVHMPKADGNAARYITVIYPAQGDATANTISASFTQPAYSENGVSLEVTVNGETYSLNYAI